MELATHTSDPTGGAKTPRSGVFAVLRHGLNTLLGRFLCIAALLVGMLTAIAWMAQRHVTSTSAVNIANLDERQRLMHLVGELNNGLWLVESSLQSYLLSPDAAQRRQVENQLTQLRAEAGKLDAMAWTRTPSRAAGIAATFTRELAELERALMQVMHVRETPTALYPAFPVMVGKMLPAATEFYTAATLAMDEARDNKHEPGQDELLQMFADVRHVQTLLAGAFRLWVANRAGAFGEVEESMRAQAANIEMYSERIETLLALLEKRFQEGVLGLQQEESLKQMRATHSVWRKSYRVVHPIYNSDRWRADVPLLRDRVQPLFAHLWEAVRELDRETEKRATRDIAATTEVADRLSGSLWLLVLAALAITGGGMLIFELHIRRPLARVGMALKAEAAGQADAPLPHTHIAETRNLVDAFRHMRDQVHNRQERLQAVLDNTAEGIITFDDSGKIETWNHAAERLFGWDEEEILGASIARLIVSESRDAQPERFDQFLQHEIQRLIGHEGEMMGRHKSGNTFPLSLKISRMELDGRTRYTALVANIAERKALMERLKRLAEHDGLTGLFNRSYILDELERLVARVKRNEHASCALLYIDLDNFKYVNDTLGHAAGDRLLTEAAAILSRRARKSDLVARLGGDEFVVIVHDTTPDQIEAMADSFRRHLADYGFQHEGRTVTVGCSIGVALVDHRCVSHTEALSHADLACHLAKRAGRNRVHMFTDRDAENVSTMSLDMGWSRRIRDAIDRDRFVLVGQPVVDTRTRETACHEILVRLHDENGSLIMPSGFLPTAERFGLAAEIDRWIIAHAIHQLAAARRRDPGLRYAINLSAQSLTTPALADVITQQLAITGLDGSALTFEVTETDAIADMGTAVEFLGRLRALGCKTALDDFGSGLSSFAYLQELPVDAVKIDGRFVRHLASNPVDLAMVKAMNDIAHALGKITVAEFVEDEDTFSLLGEIGVDYGQGYHLGMPELLEGRRHEQPLTGKLAVRR
jgi:diguanylate cyclase (GGDEF)-like protein/PAS domain S-box-containing protein